ncbi:MAG: small multi-drug export protein [Clostridia bacterium]|nr:small multi-drug export protein [Clostridia bacterium]
MVENIVTAFVEFLESYNIPTQLIPFIISLFPVLELRGGMIAARILEIDFIQAFLICFLGNMIPIPFILLFIRKIFKLMRKVKFLGKIVDKLEARADKKKGTIEKYKEWGLLIFIAIPLPGTGGWTGALIAALMDLRMKKCLPIIALGVFIAGLIMSLITYGIF